MKFQVIQHDIDEGVKGDPCLCPLARSLRRLTTKNIQVQIDRIYLNSCGYNFETSDSMKKFINDFDYGRKVVPTEFEVDKICSCFGTY